MHLHDEPIFLRYFPPERPTPAQIWAERQETSRKRAAESRRRQDEPADAVAEAERIVKDSR